jgi:hypothetical protein
MQCNIVAFDAMYFVKAIHAAFAFVSQAVLHERAP